MEIKLTVDRIEEGIAVCFDEEGNRYEINEALGEGEILSALIDESGELKVLSRLTDEAEKKKKDNSSRLAALFGRGGKKK